MKRDVRRAQIIKRKNFLPSLMLTVFLWGLLAVIIYFIDPDTIFAVPLFFILSFLSFLFTFSLVFVNSRRGVISAISITLFLILSYLGVGNILNFILIVAIAICIELYFSQK